jgi:tryptophanyl-tRNA synthetase
MSARVLSGIRPTGKLHLGNYFGAVQQFLELQNNPDNDCFFFSADLHALTTIKEPIPLKENSLRVIREYLACGVDPDKATIYRQSDIPEIPYLYSLLAMVAPLGMLQRCTTFKEKSRQQTDGKHIASAGLLTYPILQTADILTVKANIVPVGEDQKQHLEMAEDFTRRFNNKFNTNLTIPTMRLSKGIRVPGLDGSGKMGKSDGNTIDLLEDPKSIIKKVKSAKTDTGPVVDKEMSAEMSNLFYLMKLCSSKETTNYFMEKYNNGEQRFYGEMKGALANDIIALLEPIRENYYSAACSASIANEVLAAGADKVRVIAREVLDEAKAGVGL